MPNEPASESVVLRPATKGGVASPGPAPVVPTASPAAASGAGTHPAAPAPIAPTPAPAAAAAPPAPELTSVSFRILGPRRSPTDPPHWTATAVLMRWRTDTRGTETAWTARAARIFYMDRHLPANTATPVLLPGTFVARCRILDATITINGVASSLNGPTANPIEVELLLWSEDTKWAIVQPGEADTGLPFTKLKLSEAVCLAGEIPIATFTAVGSPTWFSRFQSVAGHKVLDAVANPALSSSGLAFEANAVLPWSTTSSPAVIPKARYLAEVRLDPGAAPTPTLPPMLIVLPDFERFDDAQYLPAKAAYIRVFADLASVLQPAPRVNDARSSPRWIRLDQTAPGTLPGFSWTFASGPGGVSPTASFRFDPGAWRLALSDQPVGVAEVTPLGVLSANAILDIAYGQTGTAAGTFTATIAPASLGGSPPGAGADPSSLTYTLAKQSDGYHETITVAGAEAAYDPIAVAQFLRPILGVATPDLEAPTEPGDRDRLGGALPTATLIDGTVTPQLLFGALPLEEGWAQLPFLNATDQILTDILPEPPAVAAAPSIFAGGATFGTDRPELFKPLSGEPAWSVTVLDAADFAGTWAVDSGTLKGSTLTLDAPRLELEGLFWLATAPSTQEDALPVLDDFLGAIQTFPLKTPSLTDLYPSPFLFRFTELSFSIADAGQTPPVCAIASIGKNAFSYVANLRPIAPTPAAGVPTVFDTVFPHFDPTSGKPRPIFNVDLLWKPDSLPLVWRRHATAPMIQSLPLTQTKIPPNAPSSSRQLFPFALDVELALPGLAFDPLAPAKLMATSTDKPDDPDKLLPAQYRHEMALLDEVNALATIPKEEQLSDPDDTPPAPPPGLRREEYRAFWQHQADLAFFATAEGRDALAFDGGQTVVVNLIGSLHAVGSLVQHAAGKRLDQD